MSKASEWAREVCKADEHLREILARRPGFCPEFYASGAKIRYSVGDNGRPRVRIEYTSATHDLEVIFSEDTEKLIAQARWILDTFGEADATEGSAR